MNAAKAKVPYKTTQEVDHQIKCVQSRACTIQASELTPAAFPPRTRSLDRQVESGSMKLVDEKKALAEISSLRKQRKTVESFSAQQAAIDADKAKIDEIRQELDDPEQKAASKKFDDLKKELDEVNKRMEDVSKSRDGLYDERNARESQVEARILRHEWSADAGDFFQSRSSSMSFGSRRRHRPQLSAKPTTPTVSPKPRLLDGRRSDRLLLADQKLNDERAKRDERRKAERKEYEVSKRAEVNQRLLEEAQAPAFEREIEDCQTLIRFFRQRIGLENGAATSAGSGSVSSLGFSRPKVAGVPEPEPRKIDEGDSLKGAVPLRKKSEQEEESWGGLAASSKKGGKKGRAAEADGEKLKLPFGTLSGLMALGIPAPLTTGEVQKTIDSLQLKKKYLVDNQVRRRWCSLCASPPES